jgi:hypothetical protein
LMRSFQEGTELSTISSIRQHEPNLEGPADIHGPAPA